MSLTTFTQGTKAKASEINNNFDYVGVVPIGSVLPWLKSYTNTPTLPDKFVECNGQTLSDADSPFNGQVIPNLNNENRFLRGNTVSGDTGGNDSHTLTHAHNMVTTGSGPSGKMMGGNTTSQYYEPRTNTSLHSGTVTFDNKPPYMNVVWFMRIK